MPPISNPARPPRAAASAGRANNETDVRRRLLEAALDLFATRGFSETSIRDLALAADVNVASINYYFTSKENLRVEALRYGFEPTTAVATRLTAIHGAAQAGGTTAAAEEALRLFVGLFLEQLLAEDHRHWTMILREELTPGPVFEMIMREYIEPMGKGLFGIVKLLLPDAPPAVVGLCVRSIIGQCVHLRYALGVARYFVKRDIASRRGPVDPGFLKTSSDHIAEFSVQALRGLRSEQAKHSHTKAASRGAKR